MSKVFGWGVVIASITTSLVLSGSASAGFLVRSIGGNASPASIQATVDAFRADLGNPNNGNAPGPLATGRREINWDGGGMTITISPTPFAGFQGIRGALFTTSGTGFEQSPGFGDINPTYTTTFSTFSAPRLFSALGSNEMDVHFFIPGSLEPATVGGFGAVFTDVDLAASSRLEFYGLAGNLLFTQNVAVGTVANGSLSFLGATADAGERIFRVRIVSGTTALGPNDNPGGGVDVVALDDFLYAEPQGVPEPASLALFGLGGAGLALLGWLRKRQRARA